MSIERARAYLATMGMEQRIMEFPVSSATVELAAQALGCEPAHIAKTLSFRVSYGVILVVTAGDAKVDNSKYKEQFGCKAKMLPPDEVEREVGHAVGGVCPFGIEPDIPVYLDESLRRFSTIYPACGSANSAVSLSPDELEHVAQATAWVDVCKNWRESDAS